MRRTSNVMTKRLRYEYQRAMDPVALHSFVHELFRCNGPPSLADIMYIVTVHTRHYVVDSHGRIALTTEFAYSDIEWPPWREQPWPNRNRRLSHSEVLEVSTAVTRMLRKTRNHFLRADVLYFYVRKTFYLSPQPPSMMEYWHILHANDDVFFMDSSRYVHLAESCVQPAADRAHGEQRQSSKHVCVDGLEADSRHIHVDEAHSHSAADEAHREEPSQLGIDGLQDDGGHIHFDKAQPCSAATGPHSEKQSSSETQLCSEG